MIPITHLMILSTILFTLGIIGVIVNRRQVILLLVCIELLLMAVNTNFIAFSHYHGQITGQIFVFFILAVAAAEAAIGLAIVMLLYRKKGNINMINMNELKG
ncbi:MAG TPA: NADH-quinone oxidoreductase subunit NuoK [Legionellales bacterium]|jgi:NADH-quinone oxidoreductase subunit K|nr:NADH-quinone oxidoreductase subunit NuoK [Legionellales bacterium]